ncbi:MAG: hypothetical protein PHD02_01800 [Bacilli bacterium]|nr:hypothetical protein [Bacilli bacterium]
MIKIGNLNIDKKKLIIIGSATILLIIIIITLNIRSTKQLICTKTTTDDTDTTVEKVTFHFVNGHLNTMDSFISKTPKEGYEYIINIVYNNYESQSEKLRINGGYEYELSKYDDHFEATATIDLNEIPDSTKNEIGFNNEWIYKDVKTNLEENGFNCK